MSIRQHKMKESNEKTAFDHLDELEFVQKASVMRFMGKSWIDEKRFKEALENSRHSLKQELERARKIEIREQKIYDEANKIKEEMLQETEEQILNTNIVKEAEKIATEIIERAQDEAVRINMEAAETSENTIAHGDKVKNELIKQGHEFIESVLKTALITYEENQNILLNSLEEHRNRLITAYEEILPLAKSEEEKTQAS